MNKLVLSTAFLTVTGIIFAFYGFAQQNASKAPPSLQMPSHITTSQLETKLLIGGEDPEDPCVVEIQPGTAGALKEIGIFEWQAACEVAVANQE